MKALWQESGGLHDYNKIDEIKAWDAVYDKISGKTEKARSALAFTIIKVAAVILISYVLGAMTIYLSGVKTFQSAVTENKEIRMRSPLGSKTEVVLSDGTKVWLNSGSEIRYPSEFGKKQRDLYLVGEAFFEVKKNKESPFLVHTENVDVRVLGTSFNVKSYPEEKMVETTLVEGTIHINKVGSSHILKLQPGEKAIFKRNADGLKEKDDNAFLVAKDVDTELDTSWKSGKLVFKREKFGDLAIKLERWYNVHISVNNKKLTEEKVTGIFQNESIEQALNALQISVSFSYKIDKNNISIK